jgi:hypothetical protein
LGGLRKKTGFLSHLYIKTIILPRQARDKHRENSKTDAIFRTVASVVAVVAVTPATSPLCVRFFKQSSSKANFIKKVAKTGLGQTRHLRKIPQLKR